MMDKPKARRVRRSATRSATRGAARLIRRAAHHHGVEHGHHIVLFVVTVIEAIDGNIVKAVCSGTFAVFIFLGIVGKNPDLF